MPLNTSTTVARTAGTGPGTFGASLTFTANVTSGSPASPVATGIVRFFDGGTSCASPGAQIGADQTLSARVPVVCHHNYHPQRRDHTIRACFQGTPDFASSGASTNQTVNPACTAPSVTTQPSNQTVTYGSNAAFTAAASGTAPVGVQWQVSTDGGTNWANLAGESNATLDAHRTDRVNEWKQAPGAVFTNGCGSASSDPATLHCQQGRPDDHGHHAPTGAVFDTSFTVAATTQLRPRGQLQRHGRLHQLGPPSR